LHEMGCCCRAAEGVPYGVLLLSIGFALAATSIHEEESTYELELDAWGYALLPIVLVLVFRTSLRRTAGLHRKALLHPAIELVRHVRTHIVGNDPEAVRFKSDIIRVLCALVTLLETSSAEAHEYLSVGEIAIFKDHARKHTLLVMWLGDTICAVKHRVLSEQIFGAMESHVAALQKVTLDADEVPLRANEESITGKIAWMMMSLWILTVPWPLAPLYGWKSMGITPMLGLTLWGTVAVTEKFFVSVPADLLETLQCVCGMMLPEISLKAKNNEVQLVIAADAPVSPAAQPMQGNPLASPVAPIRLGGLATPPHQANQPPAGSPGTGGRLLMRKASERMEALMNSPTPK